MAKQTKNVTIRNSFGVNQERNNKQKVPSVRRRDPNTDTMRTTLKTKLGGGLGVVNSTPQPQQELTSLPPFKANVGINMQPSTIPPTTLRANETANDLTGVPAHTPQNNPNNLKNNKQPI